MEETRVLSGITDKLLQSGFSFKKDTHLIAVQHMLRDIEAMIYCFVRLGIKPENIHMLGKYYSNVQDVIDCLKSNKIDVFDTTKPEIGEFYPEFNSDLKSLINNVLEKMKADGSKELMIIDDGGLAILSFNDQHLKSFRIVGEEQTKSGLFLFERSGNPQINVVSEASSAVKVFFESQFFTRAAIEKTKARIHGIKGRKCGVIGYGALGSALSKQLLDQQNSIYIYDINDIDVPKSLTRVSSIEEIFLECDLVYSCTGRDIFLDIPKDFKYRDDVKLGSLSSGDKEFLSLIKLIKQDRRYTIEGENEDILWNGQNGRLTILRKGYPVNFDGKSGSGSVREMQITEAMLLGGIVQSYLSPRDVSKTPQSPVEMHSPFVQKWVLNKWFEEVPEVKKLYPEELLSRSNDLQWFWDNSQGLYVENNDFETIFTY